MGGYASYLRGNLIFVMLNLFQHLLHSMSFPRRRESRKIIVILNLFQDLLKMLKQVQHDKKT
ncbi:hypothetical protein [Rickettsia endosymbiont of Orchestes rusci]|uniref:hypothetical protein n=1 Tax=Rickettsia endosymbiont of Orchestes rusci TaxID=3066250 RepID=UPI00313A81DA